MAHAPSPQNGNSSGHQAGWQAFTRYSTYATAAVIGILILMAIFLL